MRRKLSFAMQGTNDSDAQEADAPTIAGAGPVACRNRPLAAIQIRGLRRSAASSNRPFVHRAAIPQA